ncbi:MAG: FG-GAP repeat protein, partial [Gemmatimonadota bacterium]
AGVLVGEGRVGSQFGAALALTGTTALIGAPTDSGGGSVRVFRRSPDGSWSAAGTLPASGLVAGDRFGASIAVDGDRAVVGAPSRKSKGSVFVFRRAADGTWTQETEQPAAETVRLGAQFGAAVGVKGDRVFVGAPSANFAAQAVPTPAQAAQIAQIDSAFRKSALEAGQPVPPSVAANFGAQLQAGFAVVFERAKTGSWRNAGTLLPMSLASERFGAAFAMVGDELWIGAPGSDGMGRIYRARSDKDGNWTSMTKLVVDSIDPGGNFASAFAVAGDAAVVGMPTDGGGAGTVAFLGKAPTGSWTLKGTSFPPVKDQYAAVNGKEVKCGADGKAADFTCSNTGLLSYM